VRFDDDKKGYVANLSLFIDSTAKNWAIPFSSISSRTTFQS